MSPTRYPVSPARRRRAAATLAAVAAVAFAGSLAACAPPSSGGAAAETLTLGMVGNSKDERQPYSTQNSVSSQAIYHQLYDGLTRFDAEGAVQYALAESMTPNDTHDVWTVHLREGVKLHNGEEFVAEDVIDSLRYMLDPENAYAPSTQLSFIDPHGLKRVDDYTVEMTLNEPYGPVPDAFADDRMAMRSVRGASVDEPVGTGPFTLDRFTAGQQATLTRFDDYWGAKPEFERLTVQFFQEQPAITNALRGGQIDVAYSVPFTDVETLGAEDGITVLASDSASYLLVEMTTAIEPFNDPRVREAMRLIVDREQIRDNAYGGYATVANDFIGNNTTCAPPEVPQRTQDLERAKQLLAEAGAHDLSVELVTDAAFPGMMETGQLIAQQAAEAGVTIEVRKLDVATFLNRWREWPFLIGFTSNPYLVTATNHFLPGGEENATNFDDAEYNAIAEKLYASTDPEEQCGYVAELQAIEHERGGDIVPTYSQVVTAYRDRVVGLQEDLYGRAAYQFGGVSLAG